jgi:SSS family solute:Na+ symporter
VRGGVLDAAVSPLILAAYLGLLLALALLQARKGREGEGYYLAGRRLPPFLTFAAYFSTSIGGSSTLVLAALVAKYGARGLALELGGAAGFLLFGLFLARRVRRTGAFSLPHVLGMRWGPQVQKTASVLVVVAEVLWLALILRALVTLALFSPVFLVLTVAVLLASPALGGQWGLAWMDLVQAGFIFAGFLALLFLPVPDAGTAAPPQAMPPGLLAALFFSTLLPHLAGSDLWSKALSARDGEAASRAALWAGIAKGGWALLLLLVVARFHLPAAGDATLPALFDRLPAWAVALPVLSILSALLSSANSLLLTAAATLNHDLLPRFTRRPILTLGLGAAGVLLAWSAPSLLALFTRSYGFFAVSLSCPALWAFLPWKPGKGWVLSAMVLGGGAALVLPLLPALGVAVGILLAGSIRGE